jgi:putative PIN family toxin of toxin-antitoxin system
VVLDANVLVSGFSSYWKSNSVAVRVVRHLETTKSVVVVSDHLISEVGRALSSPYFRDRMTSQERMWAFDAILRPPFAYVEPIEVVGVASHLEDDIIIGTALAGNVEYLVTSDR